MPDFLGYSITRLAPASMTVPRWSVAGRIVDSKTQQTTIQDFTGANAIIFPTVLGNLTNAQQDEFVEQVMTYLIRRRFGID